MGSIRSQKYSSNKELKSKRNNNIHPIWRGVGVLMIVTIPVLGYIGALLVIESNKSNPWLTVPGKLIVSGPDPLVLLKLLLTIIIGATLYFILMIITFIVFTLLSPKEKGPYDVPPIHWKNRDKD